jgi:hypothetical protein
MATRIRRIAALILFALTIFAASPSLRAVVCNGTNNGSPCDDGNACTVGDTCVNGICTGSPVICAPPDQCHTSGVCNPANGVCSNPARANGTACDDGNLCTQSDVCLSGVCSGTPVTCTPSDQCHAAGTCNPGTGACSNPTRPNGSACDDGNACTQSDVCTNGICTGSNAVTCTASDQCHSPGTCNPVNGVCSNPVSPNGTACNDGNPGTVDDVCTSGICAGLEFHIIQTELSGANFNVTFSTVAGHQYSLESSPDLAGWTGVNGSAFTGDGNPHTSSVDVTDTPNRSFVRVLVGP